MQLHAFFPQFKSCFTPPSPQYWLRKKGGSWHIGHWMHCGLCNRRESSHGSGRGSGRQYSCEFYKRRKTERKTTRGSKEQILSSVPAAFIVRFGRGIEWFPPNCQWKEACFQQRDWPANSRCVPDTITSFLFLSQPPPPGPTPQLMILRRSFNCLSGSE